jgi:hypothetical protein
MRFRKLRIAWSVFWGLAAVLLIVLWVRSYWWADLLAYRRGQTYVAVATGRGIACFRWQLFHPWVTVGNKLGWELLGGPAGTIDSGLKPLQWTRVKDAVTVFGLVISAPCWYCVTLFATLSAVPWISWRFSLRTLLITTTLVAVVLGLFVYALK